MINRITSSLVVFCILSVTLLAQEPAVGSNAESAQELNAWAKQLGKRLRSENSKIRRSAEVAMVTLGSAALPYLRRFADSDDDSRSKTARRLISRIEANAKRLGERKRRGRQGKRPNNQRSDQKPQDVQPKQAPGNKTEPRPRVEDRPSAKGPETNDKKPDRPDRRPDSDRRRFNRDTRGAQASPAKRVDAVVSRLKIDEATATKLRKSVDRFAIRQKELGSLVRDGEMSRDELRPQLAAGIKALRTELVNCLGKEKAQQAMRMLRAGQGGDSRRGVERRRRRPEGDNPSRRRERKKKGQSPEPAVIL